MNSAQGYVIIGLLGIIAMQLFNLSTHLMLAHAVP
jgi:hypothetical protein